MNELNRPKPMAWSRVALATVDTSPTGQQGITYYCFVGIIINGGQFMTELLLRLFVKDHNNTENYDVHSAIGRLAGITGIVCNVLLFIGKFIVGFIAGSVSISADAVNNLSDALSSVVTVLGFSLAKQPADKDHPYGHARYEYLTGLAIAVAILFVGVELIKTSVGKIIKPVSVEFSILVLAVLLASIMVKLWMALFFSSLGRRIDSNTLRATSADSRNDVIATLAVLAGCLVEYFFDINIDGYVGVLVALFILYSGFNIAKEEVSLLLGKQVDEKMEEDICQIVLSFDKVLGIHDLLVHDYGPGQCYASAHVEFNAQEELLTCHNIVDNIESVVMERLNVSLVIHYDPVVLNDEECNEMQKVMKDILKGIDEGLSMHDFRLLREEGGTKLIFDLFVPYDIKLSRSDIKADIDKELINLGKTYKTDIRFDGKI